jgi:integrase
MIHDALRAAVNLAIKRGLMHRNPVGKTGTVEIPRPRRKVHVPLSFQEAEAFLGAARGHRHEHLYHLMLATGVRLGEALAIRTSPGPETRWADVEHGVLHVRETLEPLTEREAAARGLSLRWQADDLKGERYRDVPRWRDIPLTDEATGAIKAQQLVVKTNRLRAGTAWHDHGLLFIDELGEPFTQSNINHAIKNVGRRAGVERVHAHLLRRTTATYLHARGVPLATIQAILGHATIGVTMGYIDATALGHPGSRP